MELSIKDIQGLAELERKMDTGEQPFVVSNGQRMAVSKEIMNELKLTKGQAVNNQIMIAILQLNIAHCKTQIAIDNAMNK